ncbi:MAG TPA: aromatic hydrocarbon degradation protein [Thiomicrospira sp.]|nr:aromatic hydrocarbon degradation protein [Thiomicrospira sp.]
MKKTKIALAIATAALMSSQAFATNGMNMEGYGPVSTAMGGTASAYNNGLGGMMNNPATMGMGSKEGHKFQIAVGGLHPNISSEYEAAGLKQDSEGSFIMPGFGYATKKDGLTWGVGIMAQGGMGTDYGKADLTGASGDLFAFGNSLNNTGNMDPANMTPLSGETIRSEVGVGRLIVPVNYDVTEKLNIGASVDFVWGGMDLQMDMDGAGFGMLMGGMGGSVEGTMAQGLQGAMGAGLIEDVNWARFDFSDNSDFTQETQGTGLGGKLGFTYKFSPKTSFGASYHTKTAMSDFTGDATLSMQVEGDVGYFTTGTPDGNIQTITAPLTGEISVNDFQWPETFAIGFTHKPSEKWMVSADFKRIGWADTMKEFSMTFTADDSATNGGFANTVLDVTMDQNWKDQNVVMMGAQYMSSDKLTLRGGMNMANNPVPDATLNPLFPATITAHLTGGFGYKVGKTSSVDFSMTLAANASETNPMNNITVDHSQTSWQAMYSYAWGVKK